MTTNEKKKYNALEPVLQDINKNFISLKGDEIKRNNRILKPLLPLIVNKMCEKDPLFKILYRRNFYGGSYYDRLRVGKPEEYDLDLLLDLPVYADPILSTSNIPGFVHLQMKHMDRFMKQPESTQYKNFGKLFDDKTYLDTGKVLSWMEGVLERALNEFPKNGSVRVITSQSYNFEVLVTVSKGGPALTLHIAGPGLSVDLDLVTCFVFKKKDKWPTNGFRPNPVSSRPEFFIVPKKPKAPENQPIARYWRLSFQEQERFLIGSREILKPSIKLMKKMRDNLQHDRISSYFIKTAALWINDQEDSNFWNNSLSYVFITMLKEYREKIASQNIPYYWYKKNNLLKGIHGDTLVNISNKLKNVIEDVERNIAEPRTIAKYLLDSSEYQRFINQAATGGNENQEVSPPEGNSQRNCVIL